GGRSGYRGHARRMSQRPPPTPAVYDTVVLTPAGPQGSVESRIQPVPDRVAKKIETQHGQHDRCSRIKDQVWSVEEVLASAAQHAAPAGLGRGESQAKKTQPSLGENDPGHSHRGLHDNGTRDVGQQVE